MAGVLRVTLPILTLFAGVLGLFFSWGIGICLAVVIGLLLFLPRLQPKYRPLFRIERRVVNNMVHFSLMNYVATVLEGLPKFFLPLLVLNILGSEMTAYFRIAWVVSSVLFLTVPIAGATSLFAEGCCDPEKLHKNATRAISFMLGLVIPGIAIIFLLGDKILLLFGISYAENGLTVLQILALSSIPVIFIQSYLVIRMVQMRMKAVIFVDALTVVLVLGITYALMPPLGLIGIGIGWTLSQVVVAGLIGVMILMRRPA